MDDGLQGFIKSTLDCFLVLIWKEEKLFMLEIEAD